MFQMEASPARPGGVFAWAGVFWGPRSTAYFIWLSSLTAPASRRAASAVIPPAA